MLNTIAEEDSSVQSAKAHTIEQGEGIIELLPLIKDFFKLQSDLVAQVEIAKMILSNRLLKDGTMQYRYINPFDVYIKFGSCHVKRPHHESNMELTLRKGSLYPFNYEAIELGTKLYVISRSLSIAARFYEHFHSLEVPINSGKY